MMRSHDSGFTLLEILVVMAILSILAVIVVPRLADKPKQARRLKAVLQIKSFQDALEMFYVDQGYYPTTDQGLDHVLEIGQKSMKKYLDADHIPLDPWEHPYIYLSPGMDQRSFDIVSFGEDRKRGGEGWDRDVESWKLDEEKA